MRSVRSEIIGNGPKQSQLDQDEVLDDEAIAECVVDEVLESLPMRFGHYLSARMERLGETKLTRRVVRECAEQFVDAITLPAIRAERARVETSRPSSAAADSVAPPAEAPSVTEPAS